MLTLTGSEHLSDCPGCGGKDFVRASLFTATGFGRAAGAGELGAGGADGAGGSGAADEQPGAPGSDLARPQPIDGEAWLEAARGRVQQPGEYLAYEEDGQIELVSLEGEWTRIGRSLAADVRFDDPTVSRRHALVVRQADGVRMLDDRSLNGVFVNGSRIEWKVLQDGDEILVGRYRLRFLSVAPAADAQTPQSELRSAG